jgi:hypothetical protein
VSTGRNTSRTWLNWDAIGTMHGQQAFGLAARGQD